jgi:RNA polymerase sigma-70 factor (ECF subfamily)
MPGMPIRTKAADRTPPSAALALSRDSPWPLGDAMPDRAAQIEAHIPGLRRFACALLRGDREQADDLVQDSLERALSRWHMQRAEGSLRGWLYTILYNRFRSDRHRQKRRGPHGPLTEIVEAELPWVDGGQNAALEHRDLLRAFAALPEQQRSVLMLVGVEDLSYEEAARVLDVPIGTVMSRLSRGRERLRLNLSGDIEGEDAARRRVK